MKNPFLHGKSKESSRGNFTSQTTCFVRIEVNFPIHPALGSDGIKLLNIIFPKAPPTNKHELKNKKNITPEKSFVLLGKSEESSHGIVTNQTIRFVRTTQFNRPLGVIDTLTCILI